MTDMTDEERRILVEDLCCRLPFRPKAAILHGMFDPDEDNIIGYNGRFIEGFNDQYEVENVRLYLRPMSSMTEDEKKEYHRQVDIDLGRTAEVLRVQFETGTFHPENQFTPQYCHIDWLNAHHFDYHGLIPMGLALEAQKGMYD